MTADDDTHDGMRDPGRRADVKRLASEHTNEIWGSVSHGRARRGMFRGLGLFTGDIGPKADIAGGLRGLSSRERASRSEVPYGTAVAGGGRYILGAVLLLVAVAAGLLALLAWAVT